MRSAHLSTARSGSMLALALVVASSALPAALSPAQGPVPRTAHPGGIIVQTTDTSINPIAAEIVLPAFGVGIRLSEEGAALLLNIPDGLYLVQARHLGYRPEWRFARIRGDTIRLDFVLAPADGANAGLAAARLRDFLRRSGGMNMASFITRAEIERRRPQNLVALLKRIPEVRVHRAGSGPTVVRSRRAARPECASGMLLFVDGMLPEPTPPTAEPGVPEPAARGRDSRGGWRADRPMSGGSRVVAADASRWSTGQSAPALAGVNPRTGAGATRAARRTSPLDWVPISLVAAVEIYPTVTDVPPEFRLVGAECGVLLVWTTGR
jgi:hypothetical protein